MQTPSELNLPFPSWRPGQTLAIRKILACKTPFIAIPAPTGTGKSTIAAAAMQLDDVRSVVLTGTKQLQTQYSNSFPWLYDIRGMGNYECLAAYDEFKMMFLSRKGKVSCEEGPCRAEFTCTLKDAGCLYFDRYRAALAETRVLTSYAYWLSMRRFGKGLGVARRLFCDEAHTITEQLSQAWRIEIPKKDIGGTRPKTVAQWREFAATKLLKSKGKTSGEVHQRLYAKRTQERYQSLYNHLDHGWVWEESAEHIHFEPIQLAPLASLLWDEHQQVCFLSATMTPAMFPFLGIKPDDITIHPMKATFPLDRRPVYVLKGDAGVRVDNKSWDKAITKAKFIAVIDDVIKSRLDRQGIIHTVSYARARWIIEHSAHADEMTDDIHEFLAGNYKVLVHPAITTGIDFPYRLCEYQIIAKVPFPDTRSAIVRERCDAIPNYANLLTMQTIVQAVGRGMRADDDQCETFIVDQHSEWFLYKAAEFAPRDFLDSVCFERRIPAPPKRLRAA